MQCVSRVSQNGNLTNDLFENLYSDTQIDPLFWHGGGRLQSDRIFLKRKSGPSGAALFIQLPFKPFTKIVKFPNPQIASLGQRLAAFWVTLTDSHIVTGKIFHDARALGLCSADENVFKARMHTLTKNRGIRTMHWRHTFSGPIQAFFLRPLRALYPTGFRLVDGRRQMHGDSHGSPILNSKRAKSGKVFQMPHAKQRSPVPTKIRTHLRHSQTSEKNPYLKFISSYIIAFFPARGLRAPFFLPSPYPQSK
jgi:hypothetical protein